MPISNIGLQEIHLDISTKLRQKTFYANEVDTEGRGLHAFLQDNGVKVDGTGVTLTFRYKSLNDGESKVYDFTPIGDPTNGEFEIHYPTEMVRGHGNKLFPCTIVARDSTSELAFENVFVYVNKAEVNTEGIEASNEYSALQVAFSKVENLETTYAPRLGGVESQLAEKAAQSSLNATDITISQIPNQLYITNKALQADLVSANALIAQKANSTDVNTAITNMGSATPKGVYATLVALQTAFPTGTTGIYLVTADGKWYFWNGSAWTVGGTYQATGLADSSVVPTKLSFVVDGKNKFDKNAVTVSKYILDTGVLTFNGLYNVSDFIPVIAGGKYMLNQLAFGNVICFNASKVYIGFVSRVGGVVIPMAETYFVRFTVTNTEMPTTQFEVGTQMTSYEEYGKKIPDTALSDLRVLRKPKRITVGSSIADFSSVSAALASITDASADKPYEIFVFKGTYAETFRTKHYVDIIGEDKYQTIISHTGTLATWNDTSSVFAESQSLLKNFTITATDSKYPLHIDMATGKWTLTVEDLVLIHKGSLTDPAKSGTPVGIGLYPYQHLKIKNCEMIDETGAFGSSGVYFHNQTDAIGTGHRSIRIEECKISGVTYGIRPNDVEGVSALQNNDAYIINNDITATHQEYYYPENSPSWHILKKGNEYTQG